jgi:hypothetical protein
MVELTRCPYDASTIEPETDWRGPARLSCAVCGAAWEWHNAWLRRIREPDREAVLRARAERQPVQAAPVAPLVSNESIWRQVRSSISSISYGSRDDPVDLTEARRRDELGTRENRPLPS